jgi:hypothetical protein
MMKAVRLAPVAVALLLAAPSAQQTSAQAPFRFERPVQTGGTGPRRLAIDVALLAGGRSFAGRPGPGTGLADLRLFDPAGQELQYLLVANPPDEPVWRPSAPLPIATVESSTTKTSGFEIDLGQPITVDGFRMDGLPPPFLKRARLEGSGDRERWTLLVAEGTLFNLPAERLVQTELAFTPGPYRYLRLTWDDTRSGRLPQPARVAAREVRNVKAPPALTAPLAFERRPGEPGRSHFRVRLPAGRLPVEALELDMGGSHVLREATVYEARLMNGQVMPFALGTGTLKRVVQGEVIASSLRIQIEPPVEPQLDLVIEDGNNPASDVRGITAVFADLPWIYFESPGDAVVARYGNPSLQAPRYDLEAVRPTLAINTTMDAMWGEVRTGVLEENVSGAVPALPTVGSELDAALFRYLRPITPGPAGLVTVPLDASVLAHSQDASFADVRVLDATGRQVPYLVERASEPLSLDLTLARLETRPAALPSALPSDRATSVYRIRLPLEGLPASRLVLATSARVFTRRVTIGVEHSPDRRQRNPWFQTITTSDWSHADQESAAPALTLSLPPLDSRDVLLTIDEGDNTPLPLASMRLLLPAYRLRLFRERDAALRLAYGRNDLSRPQYDLALLAPQLIGVAATEATLADEQGAALSATETLLSPRIFWGVLIGAVLVLVALVVRLVRKSDVQPARGSAR